MAKVECELITQDAIDVEIGGAGVVLQDKSVDVDYNGTTVVKADDCFDGLKSVEINTNVPKRMECGDAVFNISDYNGGLLPITKVDVSCLITAQTTSLASLFKGLSSLTEIVGIEKWDTSNITDMGDMFSGCSSLQSLNIKDWDVSNVGSMVLTFGDDFGVKELDLSGWKFTTHVSFRNCFRRSKLIRLDLSNWDLGNQRIGFNNFFDDASGLKWLDMSNWKNCKNIDMQTIFFRNYSLISMTGDHTLEDVENGSVTLFEGISRSFNFSENDDGQTICFSSLLAIANGIADLTGGNAKTWTLSSNSYNRMLNDDGTKPTSDVIAERQARIAAICAAKNWNFAH